MKGERIQKRPRGVRHQVRFRAVEVHEANRPALERGELGVRGTRGKRENRGGTCQDERTTPEGPGPRDFHRMWRGWYTKKGPRRGTPLSRAIPDDSRLFLVARRVERLGELAGAERLLEPGRLQRGAERGALDRRRDVIRPQHLAERIAPQRLLDHAAREERLEVRLRHLGA